MSAYCGSHCHKSLPESRTFALAFVSVICEQGDMETPRVKDICEAAGISKGYASDIRNGRQPPSKPLAVHLFHKLGWKHDCLSDLTDEQIQAWAVAHPWVPVGERAA